MSGAVDFFFCDEIDAERNYMSFSVGDVWLYFYKEVLIAVRDIRSNRFYCLRVHDTDKKTEDGYTHRHEITNKTIDRLVDGDLKEVYPNATEYTGTGFTKGIQYFIDVDLASLAFELVASSVSQHIDRSLNVNRR